MQRSTRHIFFYWFRCGVMLLCFVWGALAQNAEERTFRRLSHVEGLSNDEVYCMTQDRRGMMWFGTADGLNSYDGIKFTLYRHREGDTTSLPQNGILSLAEDASGNLWVGTKDYLCRFHPVRGTFTWYRLPTHYPLENVRNIVDIGGDYLYLAVGYGALRFDKRTGESKALFDQNDFPKELVYVVTDVFSDTSSRIWITSSRGIFVHDPRSETLRHVVRRIINRAMPRKDGEGKIWFSDSTGIHVFDPYRERIVKTFPSASFPHNSGVSKYNYAFLLTQSHDGAIWFTMGLSLFTLNPSTGTISIHTPALRRALGSAEIICAVTDRTGVVWLGDNVRGLGLWSPYNPKFKLWRHDPTNANTISNDYIRGIWEDSTDNVWVCTQYGGLNRINRHTGIVQHYRHTPGNPQSLMSDELWGITPLNSHEILLHKSVQTQVLNTQRGTFRGTRLHPTLAMLRDRDGTLWMADSIKGEFFNGTITTDGRRFLPALPLGFENARLDAAIEDRRGRIWFAHYRTRILRYDKQRQVWDTVRGLSKLQRADYFSSMTEDAAGNMLIATKGDGIYVCDTNDRVWSISEKDGLPNNNVYGIFHDKRGALWMSSDRGVIRYDPATKHFRQFTPNDGLQGWEFNRMAFHQNKKGEIYFGGTDGLNLFHPDSVRDNPLAPPVVLTALKIFDKPWEDIRERDIRVSALNAGNLHGTERNDTVLADMHILRLPYNYNTLTFEFAALDFTAPHLNQYSWKLEGFEPEWGDSTTKHETKYTNLSPGDYVFRVRACNSDGVWNEAGFALTIIIEPAWYQTWWFRLLSAAALIAAVALIVRWRVRAVEVRNRLLEVEVHKRTKELREANSEIKRQLDVQDAQAREIELANSELDITLQDLKTTQTQLVQSERMNAIGMLTAGVMHEINNPNAIAYSAITQTRTKLEEMMKYFLSLLDDESKESDEVRKYQELSNDALSRLELAADGAGRVKTIVANLQGMTKHQEEGGKVGNLVAELTSTFSLFRMQFHTVEIVVAPDTPPSIFIRANFGEINQVFLNLLVNAAQAGATRITMTATQADSMIVLRMTDNGKGISAKTVSHIFEPFFTTKAAGNSGLGLSISKQIIERHGGEIECESELGKGTTFIVRLPMVTV